MKRSIIFILFIAPYYMEATTTQFCGQPSTFFQEPAVFEIAMNSPSSLGKTHFIVGYPTHDVDQSDMPPTINMPSIVPQGTQAFFTPDDNIRDALVRYIGQEAEKIRIAVFMITEPNIAHALSEAVQRRVLVELITDVGCLKERSNKINELCAHGCSVYIYNPSYDQKGKTSLMHHKFALFTNNLGKSVVWTGSYNFTKAASSTNQENALVIDDEKIFDIFSKQFQRLKKRSYRYGQRRKSARS